MDASEGADRNGATSPESLPLPSPAATGGPTSEPLVVPDTSALPAAPRKSNGQFVKGKSGNPAGRKPGIGNRNTELLRELARFKVDGKSYEKLLLEVSLKLALAGDCTLAQEVLKRAYVTITPEAAGLVLNVNQSQAQEHHTHHTNVVVDRLAELRTAAERDPRVLRGLGDLVDGLAAGRGVPLPPRNGN